MSEIFIEDVATAIRAALARHVERAEDRERLHRRLVRHLPVGGASEGSAFCPPVWCLRIGLHAGLPVEVAVALAAAGACFFSAADLADDVADASGGANVGQDVDDVCRLLFVHQRLLLALPGLPLETRVRLCDLFAGAGLEMVDGQDLDLAGTDAPRCAPPLRIAEGKSGAECAAFFAAPALAAGGEPAPWARHGRALGALVQVLTDYLDLVLHPESDDWQTGKPSLPLRLALEDPRHGPAVRLLAAGDRSAPGRLAAACWHLCRADGAARFEAVVARYTAEMLAAEADAGHPVVLAALREDLAPWIDGLRGALAEFAEDVEPSAASPSEDAAACRRAAWAFLAADPTFDRDVPVDRRGAWGLGPVAGGLYDRLFAAELLRGQGDVDAPLKRAFGLVDREGARALTGRPVSPPDTDSAGLALALAAGTRRVRHPGVRRGAERLLAAFDGADLCPAWLPDVRFPAEDWADGACPGATALALLGLWRAEGSRHRERLFRCARTLAARLAGPEAPPSAFHPPVVVDFLGVRALAEIGAADAGLRAGLTPAFAAVAARWAPRRRLSGRYGTVLETALAAWMLGRLGVLDEPAPVARALVDAQAPDGGYAAEPFHRRVATSEAAWYGSRVVTTAAVLATLALLDGLRP